MIRSEFDRARGYRRGTVMGLTVAEAFMLIAFVLLMLLGVWMASTREQITELQDRLAVAEPFANAFTEEQKAAALTHRDQLSEIGGDLAKVEAFRAAAEDGVTPSQVALALDLLPALQDGASPAEVLDRLRLLDEAAVRDLAEAAVDLPPEARLALTDLVRLGTLPDLVAALDENGIAGLQADLSKLAAFEDFLSEATPEDAATAARDLAAYRATGLSPDAVAGLAADVGDAARARLAAAQSREQIAASLQAQTGDLIAGLGGAVRADGSIVFRDTLLFDAGSARVRSRFDDVLRQICRPWFETLYAERAALSAVRIEGHASSEWLSLPSRAAFDRNLDLSQARAAEVFKRCLAYAGDDAVTDWARTRMTAVGFSSSRPILSAGGQEDAVASRRVVFAIDTVGAASEP